MTFGEALKVFTPQFSHLYSRDDKSASPRPVLKIEWGQGQPQSECLMNAMNAAVCAPWQIKRNRPE